MKIHRTTSAQLGALLEILRRARQPLSTAEIATRLYQRGHMCCAVSTLLSNLRRSPDLCALGYCLPEPTRQVRNGRRIYLYQLRPLNTEKAPAQEHAA